MSRLRHIIAMAIGVVALLAPVAVADEGDSYLTNPYQDAPTDWNDPWRDSTVGPRNNLSVIDGHIGSGVRVTIDKGEHFGAAMRWRFMDNGIEEPEQLWFRYYLRFPEDFANTGKGKLPGPAGLYSSSGRGNRPSTPTEPGWSARMFFSPTYDDRDADHTRIGYYLYHLDQVKNHGDLLLWDETAATLEHGRWYCIEGQVQINTPGQDDGRVTGWVDGTEAFNRDDVRLRRADESAVRIDSFWFDVYFGGKVPTTEQLQIDFDSLSFGQERLGCDDSSERGFDGEFFDDEGSVHEGDIDELRASGVIHGCNENGDRFCPTDGVTRGEMAKLLVGGLGLQPSGVDHFTDDDVSPYESAINSIAQLGITRGCGEVSYCPQDVMSRAEVAAFINRALSLPRSSVDHYVDDVASPFQSDINALAAAGITHGCGMGIFCPDATLSRGEAASIVVRASRLVAMRREAEAEVVRRNLLRVRAV
ncbi:MAG: S-layer homology domain-containing protein [Actinomycetota bacterium]|nr:S-layer homology domain-containing protein [Actinomycetota bacterium]